MYGKRGVGNVMIMFYYNKCCDELDLGGGNGII